MQVPKIKVVDRRAKGLGEAETEGEMIKVVDLRWDRREAGEPEIDSTVLRRSIDSSNEGAMADGGAIAILVLP